MDFINSGRKTYAEQKHAVTLNVTDLIKTEQN